MSKMEGGKTKAYKPRKSASRNVLRWSVAGLGVLAVAAGALIWLDSEPATDTLLASAAAPSANTEAPASGHSGTPAAAAAVPVAAAALAATAAAAPDAPSTAAIIQEDKAASQQSLKDMLNAKPEAKAAAKSTHPADELSHALERPAAEKAVSKPVQAKAEVKSKPEKHKAEQKPEPKLAKADKIEKADKDKAASKTAKAKAAPERDNDVTLLAALMAHVQAQRPKKGVVAARLKECKQLSGEEAQQCQDRVCRNDHGDAACKPIAQAKAAAGS
ncbi:hypothetical protein HSX11_08895 [Oxalobacteraceae bacterium]|nr:hypothetical protein [Oxalobacteraceae bacterium]